MKCNVIPWMYPPHRIPVTTRMIAFLVGNPYKPLDIQTPPETVLGPQKHTSNTSGGMTGCLGNLHLWQASWVFFSQNETMRCFGISSTFTSPFNVILLNVGTEITDCLVRGKNMKQWDSYLKTDISIMCFMILVWSNLCVSEKMNLFFFLPNIIP